MTTMVKVAQVAGVSISTVSHVLNGTRHVEPETRQRVVEAIETTGYRQDALARALRRARTDSIGLIVSDAGEPAFAEMVHGVEHAAARLGFTLLLANSAEDAEREEGAVEALLERRVDGLILARAADSRDKVVAELAKQGTPLVLLDRLSELEIDQVGSENREPMIELVRHLHGAGHERICLVAGDTRVPTLRERVEGFRDAVEELGLDPAAQTVIAEPRLDAVAERLGVTLGAEERPTAFIACGTVLAAATLGEFKRRDVSVPNDVAFATFDGFAYSDLFEPQITTVRQSAFDVGVRAVELLIERVAKKEGEPRRVRLAQTIEYRASTEAST